MVTKPTMEQLKKAYPNIDVDYLSAHIDRKIALINAEDEVIKQLQALMDDFKAQVKFILQLQVGDKNKLIQDKLNDFNFQIASFELDSIIHIHEMAGYTYEWLINEYYGNVPIKEVAGEQQNVVTRKKLLKQSITEMVSNTVSRNGNIGSVTDGALKSLSNGIGILENVDVLFNNASNEITNATRSVLQQSAFNAEQDVNIQAGEGYDIVYYRVEILDSKICMHCLQIDGSVNEKPIGVTHRNCRGIDVVLLRDVNTGKYYDTNLKGYGHKMRRRSFTAKFRDLNEQQKRRMLGKSNYELYVQGKLKPKDFLANGRQITNAEANIVAQLKGLKMAIDTPQKAGKMVEYMEGLFAGKEGNFGKSKTKDYYIKTIEAKYAEVNALRKQ